MAAMVSFAFLVVVNGGCVGNSCPEMSVDLLQRKLDMNEAANKQLKGSRPNLLFIVLDQWRWDFTGLDDAKIHMPTVKQLASEGIRFTRAYTASPQCSPSRISMATAREYKHIEVSNNTDLDVERQILAPTIMSALKDAGYTTMNAGKDHLTFAMAPGNSPENVPIRMAELGVDKYDRTTDKYLTFNTTEPYDSYGVYLKSQGLWDSQLSIYGSYGFPDEHPEGSACKETPVHDFKLLLENGFRCTKPSPLDALGHSPDTYVRNKSIELLQSHYQEHPMKPWFLQVNFVSPHPPFILTPSSFERLPELHGKLPLAIDAEFNETLVFDNFTKPKIVKNVLKEFVNVSSSRLQYGMMLQQVDGEIKELLDALDKLGARENTIIALASDHGEHLGDHGHFGKVSPFESAVRVPLIIAGNPLPLAVRNVEEDYPVSLIDVPMTFLELAGAQAAPTMEGHSLLPALSGKAAALTRPAVMFGMRFMEQRWVTQGLSPGVLRFDGAAALFGDSFLKLICCPVGCRKSGNLLPLRITPQVALMNVTPGTGVNRFEHDILNQPPGRGVAEALYLATFLAEDFQEVCVPLIQGA